MGGRAPASAFKDLFHPLIHSIKGSKYLTAAGAHISSSVMRQRHEHAPQRTPQGVFLLFLHVYLKENIYNRTYVRYNSRVVYVEYQDK
ncbi:hypothetical protein [Paenibacillus eucommiae]|uniref:Uncharacterized protein n=1 Tax=Paenibacillus eucommiae TaxID=1355755 RepID=A0ABS4IWF3_9BACL|nr:hypothetical protein [Paenibacillus eucommiae]MBP1991923.1 hypothetical protein [Paenibacillus eucommiae]